MAYMTAKEIANEFIKDNPTMAILLEGAIRQLTIQVWFEAVNECIGLALDDDTPAYPHDKF